MIIDFVIPWVDGSEPAWRDQKKKYSGHVDDREDDTDARYRDWDNLRYWFRGVEQFAPWVNKIFFVTCGQKPEWLNEKNKRLVLINHQDYIPEKYLPTFNSHTIELNLNRISELSEHFVYFNDDSFLTNSVQENDFFQKELPCDSAVESPITPNRRDIFNNILMNNMILLNEHYDRQAVLKAQRKKFYSFRDKKGLMMNLCFAPLRRNDFFGFEYNHLPTSMLKSSLDALWKENRQWLDETCRDKFRSATNVNQYIVRNYQYVTGKFTPYNWRKSGIAFQLKDGENGNLEAAARAVEQQLYKMVCLNDSDITNFEGSKQRINAAFEKILPAQSTFEK